MPAHDLMSWLRASGWHYCLRVPSDMYLHGVRRYPTEVVSVYPKKGEAAFYRNVGLWQDGCHRCNLVVASPQGVKEPWAVITDEPPTLQTLWQYALRFRVEELFLDSKSGAFELADSRQRQCYGSGTFVSGGCGSFALQHHSGHGSANRWFTSTG